jgi:homoserine dehydrogenase
MAKTIGVGMIGLGIVGSAVAERLMSQWELLTDRAGVTPVLRRVAVRDAAKSREVDLRAVPISDDPFAVVDDPQVSVVVEVMGGTDVAATLVQRALIAGKTVVTANKALMAMSGPQLWALAAENNAGLWFEAAVGGGLPIVALLRDSLRGDVVRGLDAVINGTTNVILTRMRASGVSLQTALAEAQERGYAEADPSSDVDGWDAAYKLVIMSWLAFGCRVSIDAVDRHGISGIDRVDLAYLGQLGYTVKLLAHAEAGDSGIHLRVRPTAIPDTHVMFDVDDSDNAVFISADLAGSVTLRGLGAGGRSTASAVVSDIVNAVRAGDHQPAPPTTAERPVLSDEDIETAGYIRLHISDDPDAKALVLQALDDRGAPVVAAEEKPPLEGPHPQLIVLTGVASRAVYDRALETLDALTVVHEIACTLDRIEPA